MKIEEDFINHQWIITYDQTCINIDFRQDISKVISDIIQEKRNDKIESILKNNN